VVGQSVMFAAGGVEQQQGGGLSLKMLQQAALASAQRQQVGYIADDLLRGNAGPGDV
jgi:hypothetical protein